MTASLFLANLPLANLAPYWHFAGEFHPAMTHFPIALIMLAAFLEVISFVRRRGGVPNPTATTLVWFGMLGALVAAALGWANADASGEPMQGEGTVRSIHRWLGVALAGFSVVVCVLSLMARQRPVAVPVIAALGTPDPLALQPKRIKAKTSMRMYQVFLLITTLLVSATGMYGGLLTYGEKHYLVAYKKMMEELGEGKPLDQAVASAVKDHSPGVSPTAETALQSTTKPSTQSTTAPSEATATQPAMTPSAAGGKVDFVKEIKPIFDARCVECHNPNKIKGKYRMDTKALAFTMGENEKKEPPIVAGKSGDSLLVKLIIGEGDYEDAKMPPKGKPLTPEQIALVKKWIDEGAEWPEGVTLSKE